MEEVRRQRRCEAAMESVQSPTFSIERRAKLPYLEYIEEYVRPNKPVIVTDAVDHWEALRKWTPSFFRERYGSMDVEMDGLTMGKLIDMLEPSEHEGVAKLPYLRNRSVHKYFPELKADISPLPIYTRPNWFDNPLMPKHIWSKRTALFIGGRSSGFPYLHYENYHEFGFVFQIYGEKEFTVLPPEQSPYVYPLESPKGIANKSSIRDLDNPDLEKFPLFAKATPVRFILGRGDMLFIPAGWWHTTRMHTVSISVNSNAANSFNWDALMSDHWKSVKTHPFTALAGMPYLEIIRLCEGFRDVAYRNRQLYSQRPPERG
jgi:hypothetical protein